MTVCVGVAVNDCIVFAADSAATLVSTDPQSGQSMPRYDYQRPASGSYTSTYDEKKVRDQSAKKTF